MPIAVITGSGTYALPGFQAARTLTVPTPFGPAEVSHGRWAGPSCCTSRVMAPATSGSPTTSITEPTCGRCAS